MGVTGDLLPDADMRNVYEVEYRLLRRMISDEHLRPDGLSSK